MDVGSARARWRSSEKFKMKNAKLLLFLAILFAPLYVIRFNIGYYPSTLLEVLVGLTVVVWVVERKGLKGVRGLNFPTALFLAAAVVSVFVSPDKRGALGILKAYFVEPILIFLVIRDTVDSKKDWWLVFYALALSGLWVALLAVFQGLTGQLIFTPHEAALGRAHAVYNTANAVGLYLGPIVFLLLGAAAGLKGVKGIKGIMVGGVGLMAVAIVLSKSNGAVVGLAVALAVLAMMKVLGAVRGFKVLGVLGFLGILAGGWFFFNISDFTPKNIDPYVRESSDTLQFRLCLWEGARNLILDRPIFGAGLSGFKELYSQKYFTCDAEPLEYPHHWALNLWTETGAFGLAAFLLILWQYFKSVNVSMCQCANERRWLALGFLGAMVYWLVHGLVDVPYFKNDLALEFWVVAGLASLVPQAF